MTAMYGTAFGGFCLIDDIRSGGIERFRVTPISRLALLLGRFLRDVFFLIVQSIFILILVWFFGLSAPLAGVLHVQCLMDLAIHSSNTYLQTFLRACLVDGRSLVNLANSLRKTITKTYRFKFCCIVVIRALNGVFFKYFFCGDFLVFAC
ncbi:MAG: ABC-2 type transporter [candidate division TM6 bacterium GW2011_GWE2_41_16]|nr:MAG: ABC-2 type transporter [candidate division TM6 bacterium GW2011_GWE2_41_16]